MRFTSDTRLCSDALPNGGRPETRQNRVEASEYTSEAAVGGSPARTSGAACTMVPVMPTVTLGADEGNWASPKSATLGSPRRESRMFSGLRSRWRMPAR